MAWVTALPPPLPAPAAEPAAPAPPPEGGEGGLPGEDGGIGEDDGELGGMGGDGGDIGGEEAPVRADVPAVVELWSSWRLSTGGRLEGQGGGRAGRSAGGGDLPHRLYQKTAGPCGSTGCWAVPGQ